MEACTKGHIGIVKLFIDNSLDIRGYYNCFEKACTKRHIGIVKLFIEKYYDINSIAGLKSFQEVYRKNKSEIEAILPPQVLGEIIKKMSEIQAFSSESFDSYKINIGASSFFVNREMASARAGQLAKLSESIVQLECKPQQLNS